MRSRKGCSQKSEPEGSSCFLGFKGAERAERKTGWLCQNGREIWREIVCEKLFFGARKFCAKFARKIWAYDLQYPKISHKFLACLVPKISRPFLNLFSWSFPPAHPGLSCHTDCSRFSWVETKPHRELGPGAQQSYSITSDETKRMCLRERCLKD